MTRKEFIEQVSKAAGLQYDLYRKSPQYVVMDLTLSTDTNGKQGIKFTIYTPETSHNSYTDFHDFVRFMELLIKNGLVDVQIKILETKLRAAQKTRRDTIDEIAETKKELEKLRELAVKTKMIILSKGVK